MTASIDLAALRHNATAARKLASGVSLCAVVKADAYGHGVRQVVPALAPLVDSFAVATLQEGVSVRALTSDRDILVLSEFNDPGQIKILNEHRLQPVLHTMDQVEWVSNLGHVTSGCWLKVDSGMHRLGIPPGEALMVLAALQGSGQVVCGLLSHFAAADEPDNALNEKQLSVVRGLSYQAGIRCSMANSAALIALPDSHFDMVRPGLMLYGVSPFNGNHNVHPDLHPVMRFYSRVIARKKIAPGATVGYGATWSCPLQRTIAIVAAGYADGYPRCVGNRGFAMIGETRVPVIGRVSMDSLALDVTGVTKARLGEEVELWGEAIDVAEVAQWAETIPYELLCRVSLRVPRKPSNEVT